MNHHEIPHESRATLVAILIAARRAGYQELEREMRRQLKQRIEAKLRFTRKFYNGEEVDHAVE